MKQVTLLIVFLISSGLWAHDAQMSEQGKYLQILGQLTTLDAGTGAFVLEGLALEGGSADEGRRNKVVYEELAGTFDPLHDYLVNGLDKVEITEIEGLIEKVTKRMAAKLRRPHSSVRYLQGKATTSQQQEIIEAIKTYLTGVKDRIVELKSAKPEEVPADLQDEQKKGITVAAGEALPADEAGVEPAPELPTPPDAPKDIKIEEAIAEEEPSA